jgi:hypothetical protein
MNLHPHKKFRALLGWFLLLPVGHGMADSVPESELIRHPAPAHFSICFNHSCQSLADVSLTPGQWPEIRRLFSPEPASPWEERERIALAVGKLESLAGKLTGIDNDRGGSLAGLWMSNQMDCVDESTNTHTYLVMLKNDGLLKYHVPADNARRFRPRLYQHYTAVIEETATQQKYAVDSWFRDNGQPPFIIPLSTWKRGWTPGDEIPESEKDN